jgi:hypothetical protein
MMHLRFISQTEIKTIPGLRTIFNGESPLKMVFSPGPGLICVENQPQKSVVSEIDYPNLVDRCKNLVMIVQICLPT